MSPWRKIEVDEEHDGHMRQSETRHQAVIFGSTQLTVGRGVYKASRISKGSFTQGCALWIPVALAGLDNHENLHSKTGYPFGGMFSCATSMGSHLSLKGSIWEVIKKLNIWGMIAFDLFLWTLEHGPTWLHSEKASSASSIG